MSRSRLAALASSLVLLVLLVSAPAQAHKPLIPTTFADPSVAPYAGGLVAVGTGPDAPMAVARSLGGGWQRVAPALIHRPTWATGTGIWAADLKHIDGRWLLYFAAPVRGLGSEGHCIGVAYATSPLTGFTPTARPLVCPRGARTPPARDKARRRAAPLPRDGAIDPSVATLGRHYLLYKTQGIPSSIRMVPLSRNGLEVGRRSVQLLRSRRIVENPQLVHRAHHVVLFASLGTFGTCGYSTVWRSAPRVSRLSSAQTHALLTTRSTGICGPGGADVVRPPHTHAEIYFSGWICGRHACHAKHRNFDLDPRKESHRALYGAKLFWRHGRPVARFVTPHPKHKAKKRHAKKHRHKKH